MCKRVCAHERHYNTIRKCPATEIYWLHFKLICKYGILHILVCSLTNLFVGLFPLFICLVLILLKCRHIFISIFFGWKSGKCQLNCISWEIHSAYQYWTDDQILVNQPANQRTNKRSKNIAIMDVKVETHTHTHSQQQQQLSELFKKFVERVFVAFVGIFIINMKAIACQTKLKEHLTNAIQENPAFVNVKFKWMHELHCLCVCVCMNRARDICVHVYFPIEL